MDVHPIPPTVRGDGDRFILGCPATYRADLMGRVDRIDEHHRLIRIKAAHQPIIVFDKAFLLGDIKLVRDQIGLAIIQPKPVQQRD